MWIGVLWFKTYTKDSDHRVGKEKEARAATMMRMMLAYTALQRVCYGGTAAFMHFSVWLAAFLFEFAKKFKNKPAAAAKAGNALPKAARSCPKPPDAARCCPKLPEAARSCPKLPELPECCLLARALARTLHLLSGSPCPKLPEAARSCPKLPEAARSCPKLPDAARSCPKQICAAPRLSVSGVPEFCETKRNAAAPNARTLFLP